MGLRECKATLHEARQKGAGIPCQSATLKLLVVHLRAKLSPELSFNTKNPRNVTMSIKSGVRPALQRSSLRVEQAKTKDKASTPKQNGQRQNTLTKPLLNWARRHQTLIWILALLTYFNTCHKSKTRLALWVCVASLELHIWPLDPKFLFG